MGIGNFLFFGFIYNKNGQIIFISNCVLVYYIGFCGFLCQLLSYCMLFFYFCYWGIYDNFLNEIKK